MTPIHQFTAAWLGYGGLMMVRVLIGAGLPRHHRVTAVAFYVGLILVGPLMLLVALVPNDAVHHWARTMRDRLDGLPR